MSVNPSHLRPGNWIHCKGSSYYGIVTGDILSQMERDEKFREKFEYIELTGELLEAAGGFYNESIGHWVFNWGRNGVYFIRYDERYKAYGFQLGEGKYKIFSTLNHFQNLYFFLSETELPLPESAKLIPQELAK